ncbi:MAG TPA: cyclase family protein [Pyrinomonadaceae bacterium]|jgi:arylformamidase|nr:cyclase family protein [Pyrinomonadaceae bacterium]
MRIIDVSVPISQHTPTYPGDPHIEIEQWAALGRGDATNVSMLHFGAHTGTHVDAPAHFIEGAPRVDSLPLDVLVGEAKVVEIRADVRAIEAHHIHSQNLGGAKRVLFKTRNSAFWANMAEGFRTDFTYLAPDAARALVNLGVRLVGIDYLSVERFKPERFETHTTLLGGGVVIVEGLDLRAVRAGIYELICLPLRITDGSGDGAPARAVLRAWD